MRWCARSIWTSSEQNADGYRDGKMIGRRDGAPDGALRLANRCVTLVPTMQPETPNRPESRPLCISPIGSILNGQKASRKATNRKPSKRDCFDEILHARRSRLNHPPVLLRSFSVGRGLWRGIEVQVIVSGANAALRVRGGALEIEHGAAAQRIKLRVDIDDPPPCAILFDRPGRIPVRRSFAMVRATRRRDRHAGRAGVCDHDALAFRRRGFRQRDATRRRDPPSSALSAPPIRFALLA